MTKFGILKIVLLAGLVSLLDPEAAINPTGEVSFGIISDRKSTRLNSSHSQSSYAVFCWKEKTAGNFHTINDLVDCGYSTQLLGATSAEVRWNDVSLVASDSRHGYCAYTSVDGAARLAAD